VFTVHNRPHYLREALESWREVHGVDTISAAFFCEPGCPEAAQVCEQADFFRSRQVFVHGGHAGVLLNPKLALDHAFHAAGADFAILAEEDMVVSTDTLDLFDWCASTYESRDDVLAVSMHIHEPHAPADFRTVIEARAFGAWVWGTWKDRWGSLGPDWDTDYRHKGWDHRINDHWVGERGYRVITPVISRAQHIGKEGGTHCTPQMFDGLLAREFHRQVPPQVYVAGNS
jgi:hypothetical protein